MKWFIVAPNCPGISLSASSPVFAPEGGKRGKAEEEYSLADHAPSIAPPGVVFSEEENNSRKLTPSARGPRFFRSPNGGSGKTLGG